MAEAPPPDDDRHRHFDQTRKVWIEHTHPAGRHPHRHPGFSYGQ